MKKIFLTQGKIALIDNEDYLIVNLFRWRAYKHGNSFRAQTDFCRKVKIGVVR